MLDDELEDVPKIVKRGSFREEIGKLVGNRQHVENIGSFDFRGAFQEAP